MATTVNVRTNVGDDLVVELVGGSQPYKRSKK